jgi:hypothetical protein
MGSGRDGTDRNGAANGGRLDSSTEVGWIGDRRCAALHWTQLTAGGLGARWLW